MICIQCRSLIEVGDSYIEWGGYSYCGTSCVVYELKSDDGLEELIHEDN